MHNVIIFVISNIYLCIYNCLKPLLKETNFMFKILMFIYSSNNDFKFETTAKHMNLYIIQILTWPDISSLQYFVYCPQKVGDIGTQKKKKLNPWFVSQICLYFQRAICKPVFLHNLRYETWAMWPKGRAKETRGQDQRFHKKNQKHFRCFR